MPPSETAPILTLEERITRLEDIEAIRRLKARYAHAADAKYTDDHRRRPQEEIDDVARRQSECFTLDAVWEGGAQWGGASGRAAIYDMVRKSVWSMTMHYLLMPDIEVRGSTATGRWYQWQTGTLTEGEHAIIMAATVDDEYRKEDGLWLISRTRFKAKFMTPIDRPWTLNRNAPFRP
jgi:SnoaL-like domain